MARTVEEVSRLAGVSRSIVAPVVNDYLNVQAETRERVREAIRKSGYQPQAIVRSLATKRARIIGHSGSSDNAVHRLRSETPSTGTSPSTPPPVQKRFLFNDSRLELEGAKVVDASCQTGTDNSNQILDLDEAARYASEFTLGVNPFIDRVMKDALFDEKIAVSLHLALGQCGRETANGNDSAIHWDIVLMQTEQQGGGEFYFDGQLIRKDGKFADEELEQTLSAECSESCSHIAAKPGLWP